MILQVTNHFEPLPRAWSELHCDLLLTGFPDLSRAVPQCGQELLTIGPSIFSLLSSFARYAFGERNAIAKLDAVDEAILFVVKRSDIEGTQQSAKVQTCTPQNL